MIDARGIANAVNIQTGDQISPRLVREYVRLGILTKALHPGRFGYDDKAVGQMIDARKLMREGKSLSEIAKLVRGGMWQYKEAAQDPAIQGIHKRLAERSSILAAAAKVGTPEALSRLRAIDQHDAEHFRTEVNRHWIALGSTKGNLCIDFPRELDSGEKRALTKAIERAVYDTALMNGWLLAD